jgi:tRNA dimethylallyltransferase
MDIGTAKPTLEERQGVPHHLIDILDPAESYSTGRFQRDALALMADISRRGRLPILAGGTMLYFRGLIHGLSSLPSADEAIRRQIEDEAARHGWAFLHAELARVDPDSAARIHPNDPQRIQRALEVYRCSGRTLTEHFQATSSARPEYRIQRIILAPASRESMHHRIRERLISMFKQGFVEEVRRLQARGDLHRDLPSMRAVGYRQVLDYLDGVYDEREALERAVIATRQFAKRQMTWLRREQGARRYVAEDPAVLTRVLADIRAAALSVP